MTHKLWVIDVTKLETFEKFIQVKTWLINAFILSLEQLITTDFMFIYHSYSITREVNQGHLGS